MNDKANNNLGVTLGIIGLIMAIVAVVISLAYRVPGPQGAQGIQGINGETGPPGPPGLSVPIGGIVIWPSNVPLNDDNWTKTWKICDGQEVMLSDVDKNLPIILGDRYGKAKPGFIKLPNYNGKFIRGVAVNEEEDQGLEKRTALDGFKSSAVGSIQPHATHYPQSTKISGGPHSHTWPNRGYKTSPGDGGGVSLNGHWIMGYHKPALVAGGEHSHSITGGDAETRPINVSVYFIMRVK